MEFIGEAKESEYFHPYLYTIALDRCKEEGKLGMSINIANHLLYKDDNGKEYLKKDPMLLRKIFAAYARSNLHKQVMQLHKQMKDADVELTPDHYSTLIHSYNFMGKTELIEEEMKQCNIRPNAFCTSGLIIACSRTQDVQKALQLLEDLSAVEKPNSFVTSAFFKVLKRVHFPTDKTLAMVKLFEEKGWGIDNSTYTGILGTLAQDCAVKECEEMLIKIKEKGYYDNIIYKIMADCYANSGNVEKVIELYENTLTDKEVKIREKLTRQNFQESVFPCVVKVFYTTGQTDKIKPFLLKYHHYCADEIIIHQCFNLLFQNGDMNLMDDIYKNCFGPEKIPFRNAETHELWDTRAWGTAVSLACIRYGVQYLKPGQTIKIITSSTDERE
eukprot:UN25720